MKRSDKYEDERAYVHAALCEIELEKEGKVDLLKIWEIMDEQEDTRTIH